MNIVAKIVVKITDKQVGLGGLYKDRLSDTFVANQNPGCQQTNEFATAHHVYLVTGAIIEIGDYYVTMDSRTDKHGVHKCTSERQTNICKQYRTQANKIIASTDKTLDLPGFDIPYIVNCLNLQEKVVFLESTKDTNSVMIPTLENGNMIFCK